MFTRSNFPKRGERATRWQQTPVVGHSLCHRPPRNGQGLRSCEAVAAGATTAAGHADPTSHPANPARAKVWRKLGVLVGLGSVGLGWVGWLVSPLSLINSVFGNGVIPLWKDFEGLFAISHDCKRGLQLGQLVSTKNTFNNAFKERILFDIILSLDPQSTTTLVFVH